MSISGLQLKNAFPKSTTGTQFGMKLSNPEVKFTSATQAASSLDCLEGVLLK